MCPENKSSSAGVNYSSLYWNAQITGMMKRLIGIVLLLVIVSSPLLQAQNSGTTCGWQPASARDYRLITQPRNEFAVRTAGEQPAATNDDLYTLPLVVHVIHTGSPIGSADNPTDGQIAAMISVLNDCWRKNGPALGGVDMKMQFQLAKRAPNGTATNGINRVDGSVIANYASGGITYNGYPGSVPQELVKNLSRWPNTDYINIWIVNKINGTAVSIGGFAYFPAYNTSITDGIVLNAAFANGVSKTIAHEMGHVFELYHTFHDDGAENSCPRTDSCSFYGDRVCDTEPAPRESQCSTATNSCSLAAYTIADPDFGYSVLNNYMNYTDCASMFTAGQKARARYALFAFRPGLISSAAGLPPDGLVPAPACLPAADFAPSLYYGIERVQLNSIEVYSNTSSADNLLYIDRSTNQRTSLYMGQTYPLTVTGSYQNPHQIRAYIDYNNDGDFDDAGEALFSQTAVEWTHQLNVPTSNVATGIPLRLRIIADNPAPFVSNTSPCALNGNSSFGVGQVEDYAVILIPANRVQSIGSGNWNEPGTWDCNCIPGPSDQVRVRYGHTVSVTASMGLVECSSIEIETGGLLYLGSNARFRQNK